MVTRPPSAATGRSNTNARLRSRRVVVGSRAEQLPHARNHLSPVELDRGHPLFVGNPLRPCLRDGADRHEGRRIQSELDLLDIHRGLRYLAARVRPVWRAVSRASAWS